MKGRNFGSALFVFAIPGPAAGSNSRDNSDDEK
jgi:hypothetical protein